MQGKDYADWDVDGGRAIPFHKGKGGIPEQESDAEKENLPPRKYAGKRLPARETTARVLCKR